MKDYPEFVFTCSQAQQFYWIKKYYPEIFTNIKEMVKQGRFIPVGGTWVELDGLLPRLVQKCYIYNDNLQCMNSL